jgi:hypothetical protein
MESDKKVINCTYSELSSSGHIFIRNIPTYERIADGLKSVAIMWSIAVFCILIPVLHFVLVPLFFILGLVLGFSDWSTLKEIVSGEFNCPSCKKVNLLNQQSAKFPQNKRCEYCYITIEITE